ncbi:Protein FRIGIDA-ESSENTIAL 1 [Linum perenne]
MEEEEVGKEEVEELKEEEEALESAKKGNEIVQDISQDLKSVENERFGSLTTPQGRKDIPPVSSHLEYTSHNFTICGPSHAVPTMHGHAYDSFMIDTSFKHMEDEKVSSTPVGMRTHRCKDKVLATKPSEGARNVLDHVAVGDKIDSISEQVKPMVVPSNNGIGQLVLRSRIRSVSPAPDSSNVSKRQAIVCDFFAKGWCIKGSSCRFLHVKSKASNLDGQAKRDTAGATSSGDQIDEVSTNIKPIARLPDLTKSSFSSTENDVITSHFSFDSLSAPMRGKNISSSLQGEDLPSSIPQKSFQFLVSKEASVFSGSMNDVAARELVGGWPPKGHEKYVSPINGGSSTLLYHCLLPENGCSSSGSAAKSRIYHNHSSGSLLNSSDYTTHTRSFYMDSDFVGTTPSEHEPSVSSDDWELSVPFQPTFIITPVMPSPGREYDRLRDSIDLPNRAVKSYKFSFISNGISTQKASHQPINGDSFPSLTISNELNGDRGSVPSYKRFHGISSDNNCSAPGKRPLKPGDMMDENDGLADDQSGTMPKEEIASISNQVDVDKKPRSDESRCRDNSMEGSPDAGGKMDQEVHKEPKSPKHLRVALVEFVKELLKPTWREGQLSKDAHNTIVKKSVAKVLSTLKPHKVPTTADSVKHYLHLSCPKIEKLVKGYCSKYGKS